MARHNRARPEDVRWGKGAGLRNTESPWAEHAEQSNSQRRGGGAGRRRAREGGGDSVRRDGSVWGNEGASRWRWRPRDAVTCSVPLNVP